jgi:hypothetical protein
MNEASRPARRPTKEHNTDSRESTRAAGLTPEIRAFLRKEIDRRTRERIAAADLAAGAVLLDEWRTRAA